jgi:hypothetical protein
MIEPGCNARQNCNSGFVERVCRNTWQMRAAFCSIALKIGSSSPGELEITFSTSEAAVWGSSASFSSRASRKTFVWGRGVVFGTLRRFGSGVSRRRPLIVSLPALERLGFYGGPYTGDTI